MNRFIFLILLLILFSCDTDQIRRDRFFIQGNEALAQNQFNLAVNFYSNAIQLDPNFAKAYNNRGVAKIEDDNPYEAIRDYSEALKIDPDYSECRFNRVTAYDMIGRHSRALEDLEILKKQFPDTVLVPFLQGVAYAELKEYKKSRNAFMQAYTLNPSDHHILINLATLDYYDESYDAAIQRLKTVLKSHPDESNAYNTLNQVYIKMGNFEEAMSAINKALTINPTASIFLNNRGMTWLMMDSLDRGIDDINQSIVMDPENMWAFRNKGIYFLKQGDLGQAIRYLRESSDSGLEKETALYLGEAYLRIGEKELACEIWRKADSELEVRLWIENNCNQ